MSTTSAIPEPWADKPWPLLQSPMSEGKKTTSHFSVHMAVDMCHVHNIIIRGLNSIYVQAPYVEKDPDVADLFTYTQALVECITAHHDGEEKYLFPGLIKYTGDQNIMAENQAQHAAFHSGLKRLDRYCAGTPPPAYSSTEFLAIIDSFAPALHHHLADEIPSILSLENIPSEILKPLWRKAEQHINDVGSMDRMFPLAFGCMDKGYENGQHHFPPVPAFVPLFVKYWFARKYKSVWRFNPCDMWGTPRPLHFLSAENA